MYMDMDTASEKGAAVDAFLTESLLSKLGQSISDVFPWPYYKARGHKQDATGSMHQEEGYIFV